MLDWKHSSEIENIASAPCILESYIGNIVIWKHHFHLETWIGYWNQKFDIGNMQGRLETNVLCCKHKEVYWKHCILKYNDADENQGAFWIWVK